MGDLGFYGFMSSRLISKGSKDRTQRETRYTDFDWWEFPEIGDLLDLCTGKSHHVSGFEGIWGHPLWVQLGLWSGTGEGLRRFLTTGTTLLPQQAHSSPSTTCYWVVPYTLDHTLDPFVSPRGALTPAQDRPVSTIQFQLAGRSHQLAPWSTTSWPPRPPLRQP